MPSSNDGAPAPENQPSTEIQPAPAERQKHQESGEARVNEVLAKQREQLAADTEAIKSVATLDASLRANAQTESLHAEARKIYWKDGKDSPDTLHPQLRSALDENSERIKQLTEQLAGFDTEAAPGELATTVRNLCDELAQASSQLAEVNQVVETAGTSISNAERAITQRYQVPEHVLERHPSGSTSNIDFYRNELADTLEQTQRDQQAHLAAQPVGKMLGRLGIHVGKQRMLQQDIAQLTNDIAFIDMELKKREAELMPIRATEADLAEDRNLAREQANEITVCKSELEKKLSTVKERLANKALDGFEQVRQETSEGSFKPSPNEYKALLDATWQEEFVPLLTAEVPPLDDQTKQALYEAWRDTYFKGLRVPGHILTNQAELSAAKAAKAEAARVRFQQTVQLFKGMRDQHPQLADQLYDRLMQESVVDPPAERLLRQRELDQAQRLQAHFDQASALADTRAFASRLGPDKLPHAIELAQNWNRDAVEQNVTYEFNNDPEMLIKQLETTWGEPTMVAQLTALTQSEEYGQLWRESGTLLARFTDRLKADITAITGDKDGELSVTDRDRLESMYSALAAIAASPNAELAQPAQDFLVDLLQRDLGTRVSESSSFFPKPDERLAMQRLALHGKLIARYNAEEASAKTGTARLVEDGLAPSLKEYGIPPEKLIHALKQSSWSSEPSLIMSQLTFCLRSMRRLESKRPGIVAELSRNAGIYDPRRYPQEALLDQFDARTDTTSPYALVANAREDYNGAFRSEHSVDAIHSLYQQLKTLGYRLRIVDVESKPELVKYLRQYNRRYGQPAMSVLGGHGTEDSIQLGSTYSPGTLRVDDLTHERMERGNYGSLLGETVILRSCSTGGETRVEKSIARQLSEVTGVTVYAPDKPSIVPTITLAKRPDGTLYTGVRYGTPTTMLGDSVSYTEPKTERFPKSRIADVPPPPPRSSDQVAAGV